MYAKKSDEAVPKDSFYRKVRKGFAKFTKLMACIISLCVPFDYIFANLAVKFLNFWTTLSIPGIKLDIMIELPYIFVDVKVFASPLTRIFTIPPFWDAIR